MTGFCGAVLRRKQTSPAELNLAEMAEQARRFLSRRKGEIIYCSIGANGFVASYDNGAWGDRKPIRCDDVLAVVSGDPLLVEADGISNQPDISAARLTTALARRDDATLAATKGSFAAASWEEPTLTLQLCADKLALRPIYVYVDSDICIFASTIRVLRELVGKPLQLDEQGLAEFIYMDQCLGSRTVYQDVRVLRPGEILTISAGNIESRFYHRWASAPQTGLDEEQTLSALYDTFLRAVKRRSRDTVEDAFLSGGLDSRCVVAGLLDAGRAVRSFGSSYPGSADDVISRMTAAAFGTEHTADERDPADRLRIKMDTFALYAQRNFPARVGKNNIGRVLWSGDGGSVAMGHVYMDSGRVALAAAPLDEAGIVRLFPKLSRRITRLMAPETMERLRNLAIKGVKDEFDRLEDAQPDRRLFLFYMLNDQMRHLWHHYEDIDISAAEFETPFFDADFLEVVAGSPTEWFLKHRLYNKWLACFRAPAASLPWQVYPGHEPGPHPMPEGIRPQWSNAWYSGVQARRVMDELTRQALGRMDGRVAAYLHRPRLWTFRWMNRLGVERYRYEQQMAVHITEAIMGSIAGTQNDAGLLTADERSRSPSASNSTSTAPC